MPKEPPGSEATRILTGRLTVKDARRLLLVEGGGRTPAAHAVQLFCAAAIAVSTARAILAGDVGPWHLALPLFAQFLGLLASIPVVYFYAPHPALRIEVVKCIVWLLVISVAVGVAAAIAGGRAHTSLEAEVARAWHGIVAAGMHWPMAFAFVGMAVSMPERVQALHDHGPPFVSVGVGCATRVLVFFGGVFLLPFVMEKPSRLVWILWGMLTFAELLAVYIVWDVQRRLEKIDGAKAPKAD